ncbi:MAG: zinc metallopeptidase, partial [Anaerolineae bacterium]
MFFFDMNYLLMVMIPAMLLSGAAQLYLRNVFGKWGQTANNRGYDGPETARHIMRHANLNVTLEGTDQQLGDHYDPSSHTARMSPDVVSRPRVASMALVAPDLGHAQQHQD